jgi:hypothetical protein
VETVVVRLWVPTEQAPDPRHSLRGIVEHVSSGRSAAFGDESQLLAFLRDASDAAYARGGAAMAGGHKCTAAAANLG